MTHRIVILGAGYAGLTAAKRTARLLPGARLTLVNRSDEFVERVRLHQLAAGQRLRHRPLGGVLADTDVELVVAEVTGIDLAAGTVHAGRTLGFDTLVYALGSDTDLATVPGVREHAFSLADPAQARRLRARIARLPDGAVIVVAGGGLTGIEAAAELAEAHPRLRVELISDTPAGAWLSHRAQRWLRTSLARMDVRLHEGLRIVEVGPDGLALHDNRTVPADLVVWAAGFRVPDLAAEAGLAVDERGRMLVDDRLRSTSHEAVYGIGDAAAGTRMSCQSGLPMGQYLASALAGRTSAPHHVRYVWQNISLGRRNGVTQFTRADDSPVPAVLTGRASARFKEAITRAAAWAAQR